MTRGGLILTAGLAMIVASGCGGDGDGQLSQAEFREQGNEICARFDKQIDEIALPAAPEDIPSYVEKAAPIVEDEIAELKELEPPEEAQETFDQMLAEEEKVLAAGRSLSDAAEADDDIALEEALNEGNIASGQADDHARSLGLTECIDEPE